MDAAALRQFARRDWAGAAVAKADYWAEEYRRRGPQAGARLRFVASCLVSARG